MLLMLALLSLLIIALCSCTTSKPMVYERTIVRTDTVIKADTMWHNRFVENIVDNVSKQFSSVKDSVATVVDEQGNVKKHEAWHWRENSTQTSKAHPKTICYLIKKINLTISFVVLNKLLVI